MTVPAIPVGGLAYLAATALQAKLWQGGRRH